MTVLHAFRLALLASLLSGFVALPAQEPVTPPSPRPSGNLLVPVPKLDLEFWGGSFGELCAQLVESGKRHGASVNIVIEPEAAKAQLPKIHVQGTELAQVLEAACAAGSRQDQLLTVENLRGSGASIYVVVARQVGQTPPAAAIREATAVHSLGALLTDDARGIGFAPATILSAVETATTEQPLRALRYHTDSRLLIARGAKESLAVVAEVLKELEQDVRRQAQPRQPRQPSDAAPAAEKTRDQAGDPVSPTNR